MYTESVECGPMLIINHAEKNFSVSFEIPPSMNLKIWKRENIGAARYS